MITVNDVVQVVPLLVLAPDDALAHG